jgi:hypothetical protein
MFKPISEQIEHPTMMALMKMPLRLILLILLPQISWGQDWPQWRGPNRDGHVQEFSTPTKWPDSLKLVWKVEAGAGLSSPVVADGRIYLLTRDDGKVGIVNIGNPESGDLIVFDLDSGKEKWRWQGPPPSSSSPIIASLHGTSQVIVLTRENLAGSFSQWRRAPAKRYGQAKAAKLRALPF